MKRTLRYCSDIHLELKPTILHNKLNKLFDFDKQTGNLYYLALVGDIGNPFQKNLEKFLSKCSVKFDQIFYVPGNHEYYNLHNTGDKKVMSDFTLELKKICSSFPNITYLDNDTFELPDFKIIGSTLWSHISDEKKEHLGKIMSEYHVVMKHKSDDKSLIPITVIDTNELNKNCIEFITRELDISTKPCIVLSHHAPLFSDPENDYYTSDPYYLNSANNEAFHNVLGHLMKKPVAAWIYGHTHYAGKFIYNLNNSHNVLVATNQLGYVHEEQEISFDPKALIDLDDLSIDQL